MDDPSHAFSMTFLNNPDDGFASHVQIKTQKKGPVSVARSFAISQFLNVLAFALQQQDLQYFLPASPDLTFPTIRATLLHMQPLPDLRMCRYV